MFKVKNKQTFLQQKHVPFMCIYFVATKKKNILLTPVCLLRLKASCSFLCIAILFSLLYPTHLKNVHLLFFKVIVILVVHLFEQHQQTTSIIIRKEKKKEKLDAF